MFKDFFRGIPKKNIAADVTFTLIWSIFNVAYVRLLSLTVAKFSKENIPLSIVIFYFGFIILWEVIEYAADVWIHSTLSIIEGNERCYFLRSLYKIKPQVIKENNTGYINGVVSRYISRKSRAYNDIVVNGPLAIIYVVYSIWQLSVYHWAFGLALIIVLAFAIVFKILCNAEKEDKDLAWSESIRDKTSIDAMSNISTIQKMQSIDFIVGKLRKECDDSVKKTRIWCYKNELAFCGYKLFTYLFFPIICLIIYFYPDLTNDKIEFLSFFSVICVQIVHVSRQLANGIIDYVRYKAIREKLGEICNEQNERMALNSNMFNNAQILNVTYNYTDKEKEISTTVKIPFFQLNKGDKICVYGESGQGKTTLLNILSGEIETNGVLINGREENTRLECVFISQDTEILDMSIRDNLTLGADIPDEEIIYMIEQCGLKDWFNKQKDGLDTILGERGCFVSTGQKQRLGLIRGILIKDKEIYLLDEPTSNVDEKTEEKMIALLNKYLKDKTIVTVTHRPKIKEICNKAYKFTNGVLGHEEKL